MNIYKNCLKSLSLGEWVRGFIIVSATRYSEKPSFTKRFRGAKTPRKSEEETTVDQVNFIFKKKLIGRDRDTLRDREKENEIKTKFHTHKF